MTRKDLEKAVVAAMDAATETPMRWGVDDCALWFANIIHSTLGYDPAKQWRTRYRTRRGAMRSLGRLDLLGAFRTAARRHGWTRINPALAQPGDAGMAWTTHEGKPLLAAVICRSRGWFVGRADEGVSLCRADHVAVAWSVLPDALANKPGPRVNLPSLRRSMVPTSAVAHDPISIFILTSIGISATATAVAVTTFIVTAAISVGVSLVSSLLMASSGGSVDSGPGGTSDVSPLAGAQVTERQPIPYKRVIVGSAYVGGALFFEQVKPPHLTMGVLINYGQIAGVDKLFVGTNEISFSAIIPNSILIPIAVAGQADYPTNLRASFRYGSDTQAVDPLILSDYPNVGSEFRQRGIATAVYQFGYGVDQAEFIAQWGQVARPSAYLVVRGVVAYDPREPTQSLSDTTTWQWTNNATLIQAWYLTRPFGGRIPTANIRWDKIAISADYDDDLIGCNDGTLIKRHTVDGVITLNQQPFNVMQDLLTANRGMVLESGGRVWIESSRPKTSIATIHDRILAGGVTYQAAKQKTDKVNKLQVRFVSPDQDYQVVDGPILDRTDLQTLDGQPLVATLALNFTQDHRRAQRLQKAFLLSTRLAGTITCTVDIRLMAIAAANAQEELVGSVLTVDSSLFSKMNGTYIVTAVGFADDCTTLSLALARYDSTIETNWNPETDEQPFVLAAINTA